jgi:hypothetical protein
LELFEKLFSEIIKVFEIILFLDVKVRGFINAQMRLKKCKILTLKMQDFLYLQIIQNFSIFSMVLT